MRIAALPRRFFAITTALIVSLGLFATGEYSGNAQAQDELARRELEHKDYDRWNSIVTVRVSRDGKWVMYQVAEGKINGESTMKIRNLKSSKEYVVPRGSGGQFTHDSRHVIYRITPEKEKVKALQKAKAKPDAMPKTKLEILELASGDHVTIDRIQSFSIPEENGDWLAYTIEEASNGQTVSTKTSKVSETYEVTPEGLRRPEKKLKLKKREELAPRPEEEEKKEAKKAEEKSQSKSGDKKEDDKGEKKKKSAGSTLVLHDLDSGIQRSFPYAKSFRFSKDGSVFTFVTSVPEDDKKKPAKADDKAKQKSKTSASGKTSDEGDDDQPTDGVHVIDLATLNHVQIIEGVGNYKNLTLSDDGKHLAFISDRDDYKTKSSTHSLYYWKEKSKEATKIATEGDDGIPNGWWVAPGSSQRFSEDNRRLFFDTAPLPESVLKERKETAAKKAGKKVQEDDDEDKAKLDIWHWQDPQLQPQQLLQARMEAGRDYVAAYNLKSKKIVQLGTRDIPSVSIDYRSKSDLSVAVTNQAYRKMLSWDIPGFQDTYLVNLETGERKKTLEKVKFGARISPEGKFISWFDAEQKKWFVKSTSEKETDSEPVEVSAGIEFPLQNELHDTPNLARAYGSPGWTTDDKGLLIYDRYDIWHVDPTGSDEPVCLTGGEGRENKIRYRYQRLDSEERAVDLGKPMYLSAFNEVTKASGFAVLQPEANEEEKSKKDPKKSKDNGKKKADDDADEAATEQGDEEGSSRLQTLIMLDEALGGLRKAETTDSVVFTRSTFEMCPDLWTSDLKFKKISRLSDINPQQDEYTWGTAELVHWDATDGQKLDGILYKPDGFDPAKKYPMMVYFYERNSDRLHSYFNPAAGRSIINHSFYVSRGYLVFVPDIPYKTGEPGPSAANAILPGVKSLVELGFVDEAKIGMQGHSWGGYQTAYLVTVTDMFACAESGAPVSNMTSAYGGIRWSSGMSRMFQYERTQSRIGDTLWSARDKYLANSPVFFADKINTPLLILHNDEDGAVPWYQGIELFVALRRLEKPSWMLNYNGNPHWVMGEANRRDFAIRMQQFFDHYLKDAPEPEWMAVGVPAVDKGKKFGLELLEPEKPAAEESSEEASETEAEAKDR